MNSNYDYRRNFSSFTYILFLFFRFKKPPVSFRLMKLYRSNPTLNTGCRPRTFNTSHIDIGRFRTLYSVTDWVTDKTFYDLVYIFRTLVDYPSRTGNVSISVKWFCHHNVVSFSNYLRLGRFTFLSSINNEFSRRVFEVFDPKNFLSNRPSLDPLPLTTKQPSPYFSIP